jgi:hypothetical protein
VRAGTFVNRQRLQDSNRIGEQITAFVRQHEQHLRRANELLQEAERMKVEREKVGEKWEEHRKRLRELKGFAGQLQGQVLKVPFPRQTVGSVEFEGEIQFNYSFREGRFNLPTYSGNAILPDGTRGYERAPHYYVHSPEEPKICLGSAAGTVELLLQQWRLNEAVDMVLRVMTRAPQVGDSPFHSVAEYQNLVKCECGFVYSLLCSGECRMCNVSGRSRVGLYLPELTRVATTDVVETATATVASVEERDSWGPGVCPECGLSSNNLRSFPTSNYPRNRYCVERCFDQRMLCSCGAIIRTDTVNRVEGRQLCRNCFGALYFICRHCAVTYLRTHAHYGNRDNQFIACSEACVMALVINQNF